MSSFINKIDFFNVQLKKIDTCIDNILAQHAIDISQPIFDHILLGKGKFFRPVLVLLSSHALDETKSHEKEEQLIQCAAAIEMIHMASLIHDDVIDDGKLRRNRETLNLKYGNKVSVTMGVLIYSLALTLVAKIKSSFVLNEISLAVKNMCNGELLQLDARKSNSFSKDLYFKILHYNTASLFEAAAVSATHIVGASSAQCSLFRSFSYHLGISFQLTDDILDLSKTSSPLNKEMGQDYYQGQLTLPMVLALESFNEKEKERFDLYFKNRDIEGLRMIQAVVENETVISKIYKIVLKHIKNARNQIVLMKPSKYTTLLHDLINEVEKRACIH